MMTIEVLHETFTRHLPELEAMALVHLRGNGPEARQEAIQNTTCLAWKYWLRLAETGRPPDESLLRSVWWYAIKQTRSRREITRGNGKRGKGRQDVYDRTGTAVEHIDFNSHVGRMASVADQVAFRLDLPAFLATLNDRQRAMAADLATGMTTGEVARLHGVTSGAVSQFRTRFKLLMERFHNAT
jgi:DNA-directed RNA polymerase specialized sigma24 family protein